MRELILDAASWKKTDDVYDAFFAAAGAPTWHGRNLDALNDSIGAGGINGIELPYKITIRNADLVGWGATRTMAEFVALIENLRARGYAVEVETIDSK